MAMARMVAVERSRKLENRSQSKNHGELSNLQLGELQKLNRLESKIQNQMRWDRRPTMKGRDKPSKCVTQAAGAVQRRRSLAKTNRHNSPGRGTRQRPSHNQITKNSLKRLTAGVLPNPKKNSLRQLGVFQRPSTTDNTKHPSGKPRGQNHTLA